MTWNDGSSYSGSYKMGEYEMGTYVTKKGKVQKVGGGGAGSLAANHARR